jgi:hypothetical protein
VAGPFITPISWANKPFAVLELRRANEAASPKDD